MSTALYNAMSAAAAQSKLLDVTAQNVANASTPGYKAQRMTFEQALGHASPQVKAGPTVADDTRGDIRVTGNPLDLALPGEGYFVLSTPAGDRLTRAGGFSIDAEGYVVDPRGNPLQVRGGGLLQVPPHAASVAVGADGTVQADGEVIGTVRVAAVAAEHLRAEGTHFAVAPDASVIELDTPEVQAGALEQSNFDVVRGMVDLIRASRTYEAATRTMQTMSEQQKRAARGFGG